jgi:hypothetical protein
MKTKKNKNQLVKIQWVTDALFSMIDGDDDWIGESFIGQINEVEIFDEVSDDVENGSTFSMKFKNGTIALGVNEYWFKKVG